MKEKHVRFIENYVEFSQQGIDWLRERIELEEIQFISFSEYAKKLFAENDMAEIMLAELLKESSKLICLVGPQGCGKSSTAVKVIETVKERHSLIKIFYFNYRIIDAARSDKHRISYDFIKSKILEELQTEIEITGKDGILTTQRLDFYYFLLKPELEQTVKFETSDLNKLRNTLMIHFNAERRKDEAFHKYFYTELPKSQFFADFHTELLEAIDIPHYLYYFTHTQKYSYCVFWLDNIDAFSHIEREELVNIAHKMEMNMMTKASFVVAVREENIYRVGKFQDSVNEPFLTKVSFADTADEKYNAVNSALIKDGMLLDILDRVADYIPDYQHKKISSLERQKKIIENKDSKPIEIEEIGKQIIHEKSLLLLDTDITVIKGLIKTLFDIFKKEKIILLANNSIREFKSLFSTHLKHVYENHVDHEK